MYKELAEESQEKWLVRGDREFVLYFAAAAAEKKTA